MSLVTVRAAIATVLGAVTGISGQAKVHDYFRMPKDPTEKDIETIAIGPSGRPHVWMVTLAEADPFITVNQTGQPGRRISGEDALYTFNLHGFYAHNDADASEKAWDVQLEAVLAAFRANKKLGLGFPFIEARPPQWVEGGYRFFPKEGGWLCHYARLVLVTKEQREP